MIKVLRVIGELIASLIIGAIAGLLLYFLADATGFIGEIQRELPLLQVQGRLPFRGLMIFGALLGVAIHLLVGVSNLQD